MNKRKTVWIAAILVTGITVLVDRIRVHKKMKELNERITEIGHCHNDFCLMQGRINQSTEEQIVGIQEEIGSVYEHLEELLDMKDVKCKYADECEELDCYYEEYAEKVERELNEKKKEDGR